MAAKPIKRGDTWYIRYELPPIDGKRRQMMEPCPGLTKRQAEELLHSRLMEIRNGGYRESHDMTVAQLFDQYALTARQHLSLKTLENYTYFAKQHIIPKWGYTKIDALSPMQISRWYTALQSSGRRDGNGGLSPKTVRNLHGAFHAILQQAVEWGATSANPLDRVKQPKIKQKEIHVVNRDELDQLEECLRHNKQYIIFLLAVCTGMRRGELAGLRWEDVDLQNNRIFVRRSVTTVSGRTEIKEPKSGKARCVSIPASLAQELWGYREASHSEWVMPNAKGGHHSISSIGHAWSNAISKTGLDVHLHQLRHTHATELIMAGLPVKVVSERLGHSDTRITQDTYTHVLQHMQTEAAEMVERLFLRKETSPSE